MDLTKKILSRLPDGLKIRLVPIDETERGLFDLSREGKRKTSHVFNDSKEEIEDYDRIIREMKKILTNKYQNGRFHKYFLNQVYSIEATIKVILGY